MAEALLQFHKGLQYHQADHHAHDGQRQLANSCRGGQSGRHPEARGGRQAVNLVLGREFQDGAERLRWINGLHRLDPASGQALIRVAEADRPQPAPQLRLHYTWRRWDLLNNRELEKLQLCGRPDAEYEESHRP